MNTLKSENEGYGFYGTMYHEGCSDTAWDMAISAISATTGAEPKHVRAFLDSRWGRHFADDVRDVLSEMPLDQAVAAAVTRWDGWELSAPTRAQHGIPPMPSYLSGMVYAAAMYAEVV